MHAWEQIQKVIDQIEEHLYEDVKTETLANTAALSQFYFQRLFKRLVQKTVNEYVKLRRLASDLKFWGKKANELWILPWTMASPVMKHLPGGLKKHME
jgi:methylphosphotriester-DNA--protein-cysteine methyltransferase